MKVLLLDFLKDSLNINTNKALHNFIEGAVNAGAEVKKIKINDLDINPCFSCTTQSSFVYDEKCRCNDDMNDLYPLFRESENWVFAIHVTSNGSTKYLNNLLDRLEPLFQPDFMLDGGADISAIPETRINGKIMLFATYNHDSEKFAQKISDYIDSMGMLFAKDTPGNILFDENNNDLINSGKFYSDGKSLVTND